MVCRRLLCVAALIGLLVCNHVLSYRTRTDMLAFCFIISTTTMYNTITNILHVYTLHTGTFIHMVRAIVPMMRVYSDHTRSIIGCFICVLENVSDKN